MAGSAAKDRVVYPLEKRVINPIVMLAHNLGFPPPGDALLEMTGRRTGLPRRTPVCDGLDGEVFWLVAQRGRRADWVRNIQANPRVRVKVRSGSGVAWRAGTARILDDDDPRERGRLICRGNLALRLCVGASAAMATDPLTVRIDLDARRFPGATHRLRADDQSLVMTTQYSRDEGPREQAGIGDRPVMDGA
jgi:deazaflavin-dependent oxidoreductase (nitroreductase family)